MPVPKPAETEKETKKLGLKTENACLRIARMGAQPTGVATDDGTQAPTDRHIEINQSINLTTSKVSATTSQMIVSTQSTNQSKIANPFELNRKQFCQREEARTSSPKSAHTLQLQSLATTRPAAMLNPTVEIFRNSPQIPENSNWSDPGVIGKRKPNANRLGRWLWRWCGGIVTTMS